MKITKEYHICDRCKKAVAEQSALHIETKIAFIRFACAQSLSPLIAKLCGKFFFILL